MSPGCLVGGRAFLDGRLVGGSPGCIGEREGGESPGSSVWLRRGGGRTGLQNLSLDSSYVLSNRLTKKIKGGKCSVVG